MKLEYGMIVLDVENDDKYIVSKYWNDDTDPMAYKVKLIGVDIPEYTLKFYSGDLVSMIQSGFFKIQDD